MDHRQSSDTSAYRWPPSATAGQAKKNLFDEIRRIEKLSKGAIPRQSDASEGDEELSDVEPLQGLQEDILASGPNKLHDASENRSRAARSLTVSNSCSKLVDTTRQLETLATSRGLHRSSSQNTLQSDRVLVPSNSRGNSDGVVGLSSSPGDASDNITVVANKERIYRPLSAQAIARASTPKPSTKRTSTGNQKQIKPTQLFRHLVFYFYPNNAHNKPRQLRIEKAIEYGAIWHQQWSEDVTHIITDAVVNYSDLIRHLPIDPATRPELVIVNEQYPSDCINYRWLMDSSGKRYGVVGAPATKAITSESSLKRPLPSSLELKPSKRQNTASQSTIASNAARVGTVEPPQNDDDTTVVPATAVPSAPDASLPHLPKDDLTATIAEARGNTALDLIDFDDDEDKDQTDNDARDRAFRNRILGRKSAVQLSRFPKPSAPFRCQNKFDGTEKLTENPNTRTIEVLRQMSSIYERMQDNWRSLAYRKAINTLEATTEHIETAEQAKRIKTIGPRLADKIEEIVTTDRLQRLESALDDSREQVLIEFMRIYGVGMKTASTWVEAGHRTFNDLKKNVHLTPNQIIGIEHADDFDQRIPRAEIEQHFARIKKLMADLDPGIEMTIMGSYRRGAKDSGDIDLIFTKPQASTEYLRDTVLRQLIALGKKQDYIMATLTDTYRKDSTKWHGACSLTGSKGTWRRVDFLIVPWQERGAALLYFTGNDIFNRSIRLLASRRGMRLNQRGLYKNVMRGPGRVKVTEGELLEGENERRIFEILGVEWREPHERNC